EDNNIDAYIPKLGQYKPHREGFLYNAEKDQYECIQEGGNKAILPFKGIKTDSKGYTKKTFRSSESDCKNCPLREHCCGKVSKFKKLDESIHKPLYDKMHEKLTQNKAYHRRLVKRRSSTVEPVLGTLTNHHNMKRINSRGIAQANKHILMAALTYNLKKYLKFTCKTPQIIVPKITLMKGLCCFLQTQHFSNQNRGYKLSYKSGNKTLDNTKPRLKQLTRGQDSLFSIKFGVVQQ